MLTTSSARYRFLSNFVFGDLHTPILYIYFFPLFFWFVFSKCCWQAAISSQRRCATTEDYPPDADATCSFLKITNSSVVIKNYNQVRFFGMRIRNKKKRIIESRELGREWRIEENRGEWRIKENAAYSLILYSLFSIIYSLILNAL
jgi:hypothetical protein